MGLRGQYVLELTCDDVTCKNSSLVAFMEIGKSRLVQGTHQQVSGDDQTSAVARARAEGWIISTNRVKCPACAKRRTG